MILGIVHFGIQRMVILPMNEDQIQYLPENIVVDSVSHFGFWWISLLISSLGKETMV